MPKFEVIRGGGEREARGEKPWHEALLKKLKPMNEELMKMLGVDWVENSLLAIYRLDSFRLEKGYSDEEARKIHPHGPEIVWILSKLDTDQPPPRVAAAAKGKRSVDEDQRMAA